MHPLSSVMEKHQVECSSGAAATLLTMQSNKVDQTIELV